MPSNIRNRDFSSYSNAELNHMQRQENLRQQYHINHGHGLREQACNGVQRAGIWLGAFIGSILVVGVLSTGTLALANNVGSTCDRMKFTQWLHTAKVSWSDTQIKTWRSECSGQLPRTPGKGIWWWLGSTAGLIMIVSALAEQAELRKAGFIE